MDNKYNHMLELYLKKPKFNELEAYMLDNAILPQIGTNIPLSDAFASHFNDSTITPAKWKLLCKWSSFHSSEAPTDSPKEFLCICAIKALSEFYTYASVKEQRVVLTIFKSSMNDKRLKIRESVVAGLKRISEKNFFSLKKIIITFFPNATMLEKRAFILALTNPNTLKVHANDAFALNLTEQIFKEIMNLTPPQLESASFRLLAKTLNYSISVFVAFSPEEGFEMLRKFAIVGEGDNIIKEIIKNNLKKVRLSKYHPDEVEEILDLMKS